MNILIFISGFGNPHWQNKVSILKKNLTLFNATRPFKSILDVIICQYEMIERLPSDIPSLVNGSCDIIIDKGFVGDFFRKVTTPERVAKYDYILSILDDVELNDNFNLTKMIELKNIWNLDLISPCIQFGSKAQFKYMYEVADPSVLLRITNACEYFCYLMDLTTFIKYQSHIREYNPFMWGVDGILVKHIGLRVGMLNTMTMNHHYKNESYEDFDKTYQAFVRYINEYDETPDSLAMMPSLAYAIHKVAPI